MAGHSKWKSIKHAKASNDQKRAALFTKIGREVMSSARLCAGDMSNPQLSSAIAKARANNVPKDNIEYWMSKATGGAAQESLEEVVYEGIGPGSVQMIVRTLTDNRKRTFPTVRHQFTKHGGELGVSGSVAWNFERTGYGSVKTASSSIDDVQEICIDNGADDVDFDEETNTVQWYCDVAHLMAIRRALEEHQLEVEITEILFRPKDTMEIPQDKEQSFRELLDALEDEPDVQDVYHNAV